MGAGQRAGVRNHYLPAASAARRCALASVCPLTADFIREALRAQECFIITKTEQMRCGCVQVRSMHSEVENRFALLSQYNAHHRRTVAARLHTTLPKRIAAVRHKSAPLHAAEPVKVCFPGFKSSCNVKCPVAAAAHGRRRVTWLVLITEISTPLAVHARSPKSILDSGAYLSRAPSTAQPLPHTGTTLNSCGWYGSSIAAMENTAELRLGLVSVMSTNVAHSGVATVPFRQEACHSRTASCARPEGSGG